MRALVSAHPQEHLVFSVFLVWDILLDVLLYLIMVLVYIFFIDITYLFMCLFAIYRSSVVKYLFKIFAQLVIGLFVLFLSC